MSRKKGQVTAYVIIGIILLAAAIASFTFRSSLFQSQWEREVAGAELLPPHAQKIKELIEGCMRETMIKGANLLGSRGGYMTLPEDTLPVSPLNLFSNKLDLFNDGNTLVAYWFYEAANGIPKTAVPSKQNMEIELAVYMDRNLVSCIKDFAQLKREGYDIIHQTPQSTVSIKDAQIQAKITFPVTFSFKGTTATLRQFYGSIDHTLGNMYSIAVSIMNAENEQTFLENITIDMLSVYEEIPFSGIDFECSPKTWKRTDVEQNIKSILSMNIPFVRVKEGGYAVQENIYKSFEVDIKKNMKDVSSTFLFFPTWPLAMDILGEEGPVIRGKPFATEHEMSKYITQFFCLNNYNFVYDMKFPILVSLTDKNNNVFQFATMVIVDNNQPRINTLAPSVFDVDSPICENAQAKMKVFALGSRPDNSLVPLTGAKISFRCVTALCSIGETKIESNSASVTALFPQCINGVLIAEKEGFFRSEEIVSTMEDAAVSITLQPLYELAVNIQISANGEKRPAQPTEQVSFTFTEKESGYTTTVVYPGQQKVSLIPGEYEVQTQTIVSSDPPLSIEGKTIKVCNDVPKEGVLGVVGFTEKKCVEQKIDAISLDQIAAGSATVTWKVDHASLAQAEKITLYGIRTKLPRNIEELTKINEPFAAVTAGEEPRLD